MCATHTKVFERSFEPLFRVHAKKSITAIFQKERLRKREN